MARFWAPAVAAAAHRSAARRLSLCRVRLMATCRTLRAASVVDWFRSDVFRLDVLKPPTAQHLAWLCQVQGEPRVGAALRAAVPLALCQTICGPGANAPD